MFCVGAELAKVSGSREGDIEAEQLFMPSGLPSALRQEGCYRDMGSREAKLREAQCYDALETIRTLQRTKRSIQAFRHRNLRGVAATTRTSQVLDRLAAKSELAVMKYRIAREALLVLCGPGPWQDDLRILNESDVRALDSQIFDIDIPKAKKQKLGNAGADVRQFGSGSYEISWIWMVKGAVNGVAQDDIDGQLRVEWLKSRARVNRYREEVAMVTDERSFTIKALEHEACRWESERSAAREDLDAAGQEGVTAHAKRQAWLRRRIASNFQRIWASPARIRRVRVRDRSDLQDVEMMSDSEGEQEVDGDQDRAGLDGEEADDEVEPADDEGNDPPPVS